jgi:signal transduction histidine kinase/DNA-binding response OmpR family regulator
VSRVYVVEADEAAALELAEVLRSAGLDVCGGAGAADEAYAQVLALQPDLLIVDVHLAGGASGIALVERLRLQCDVPVIFLTAHADAESTARAARTTPSGFLRKPFDATVLRTHVELALARRRAEFARRQYETALRVLSTELHEHSGRAFFEESARRLAEIAGVEVGFVAVPVDDEKMRLRTLAFVVDGVPQPDLEYRSPGTPCEPVVLEGAPNVVPENVLACYPADADLVTLRAESYAGVPLRAAAGQIIGHVGVIGRRRLDCEPILAILTLFALRIAAELQRQRVERERDALRERMHRSQKLEALGTLAGGIAHDFNNLLATIAANAELARAEAPAAVAERIDEITTAAARARALVRQILTFGRQRPPQVERVQVEAVAAEVVRQLAASAPPGATVTLDAAPELPAIDGDPTQVHQVLMNLGTNALQALGGAGGGVRVALDVDAPADASHPARGERGPAWLRIRVIDDGEGMDEATAARAFEPFFTTKGVGKGTGLGLSVTHGVVTAHGGTVDFHSVPGRGTTFTVRLPVPPGAPTGPAPAPTGPAPAPTRTTDGEGAGAQDRARAPSPPPGEERAARSARVLLVDDEAALQRVHRQMLARLGHAPSTFDDPRAALDALRADPCAYDVVVTDLNMPGMNGLELAREVRRLRPSLPVLLISGHLAVDDDALGDAGVRFVLEKPYTSAELGAMLQRVLAPAEPRAGADATGPEGSAPKAPARSA